MRTAESQQASLDGHIEHGSESYLSDVSIPMCIDIDFTRVRPAILHIFLGLVNDEVSDIRDEMPKLDPADPVLITAHATAVEKGEDKKH
jgi:hypothetical protein